jgi:hypothetical protein
MDVGREAHGKAILAVLYSAFEVAYNIRARPLPSDPSLIRSLPLAQTPPSIM